jgi:hypothetical protein
MSLEVQPETDDSELHGLQGLVCHRANMAVRTGCAERNKERGEEASTVNKILVTKVEELKLTGKCGKPTC